MRDERKFCYFLLVYGCLLLLSIWQLSLVESTEGRYGEIAREMLASGNFLEPRFNGIYHFHKPPLPYWGMAAGMALFGVNDFGVRFFGAVAAVIALYFFYRTAQVIFDDRRQAFSALLVLASSLLFIAVSRLVSTDIYLTCCVMGAHFFLFNQVYGQRSRRNAVGYGLLLGLGFMVKGPVVFLFTLLPQLAAKFVDQRHRRLFNTGDIMAAVGSFLAVALPWYVSVIIKHPGLFSYFTMTQTVDRVASDNFHRNRPFWFFPLLFVGTFLPYTFSLLRGACRFREWSPRFRAQLLYLLLPFAVFCLSKSKLPPYIVPFYGTAAVMAVYSYTEFKSVWDDRAAFLFLLFIAVAMGVVGFVSPDLQSIRLPLAIFGTAGLVAIFPLRRLIGTEKMLPVVACLLIGFGTVAYLLLPLQHHRMEAYKDMVTKLNQLDPERQLPTVAFETFLPSVSFYRQKLAIMVRARAREMNFETDTAYKQWYFKTNEGLQEALSVYPRLFLITAPKYVPEFSEVTGFTCSAVFVGKKNNAYDCRR